MAESCERVELRPRRCCPSGRGCESDRTPQRSSCGGVAVTVERKALDYATELGKIEERRQVHAGRYVFGYQTSAARGTELGIMRWKDCHVESGPFVQHLGNPAPESDSCVLQAAWGEKQRESSIGRFASSQLPPLIDPRMPSFL
jgi:hypothetical protein